MPIINRTGSGPVRVQATQRGFYGNVQREPGDVFTIATAADFSARWMRRSNAPVTRSEEGARGVRTNEGLRRRR